MKKFFFIHSLYLVVAFANTVICMEQQSIEEKVSGESKNTERFCYYTGNENNSMALAQAMFPQSGESAKEIKSFMTKKYIDENISSVLNKFIEEKPLMQRYTRQLGRKYLDEKKLKNDFHALYLIRLEKEETDEIQEDTLRKKQTEMENAIQTKIKENMIKAYMKQNKTKHINEFLHAAPKIEEGINALEKEYLHRLHHIVGENNFDTLKKMKLIQSLEPDQNRNEKKIEALTSKIEQIVLKNIEKIKNEIQEKKEKTDLERINQLHTELTEVSEELNGIKLFRRSGCCCGYAVWTATAIVTLGSIAGWTALWFSVESALL